MSQLKPGDRIQYVGKKDHRYDSESIWGKVLTVVTVHDGYLSADTPPMGYRADGYRTTWIDFADVILDEQEDYQCAA
jgi:putative heme iron utilization protein